MVDLIDYLLRNGALDYRNPLSLPGSVVITALLFVFGVPIIMGVAILVAGEW